MRDIVKRRPSPALVVALVALFVAFSGTATAALVMTGKNIKDATITGKDVKNRALGTNKLSERAVSALKGQSGPAGPQGATGPQGPTGEAGVQGPKGDTGVAQITTRIAGIAFAANGLVGETKDGAAMCQAGESVGGGGYRLPGGSIAVGSGIVPIFAAVESRPANASGEPALNGQEPRGWYVEVQKGTGTDGTAAITVLCASA